MEELVYELSSCQLDHVSPSQREEVTEIALHLLEEDDVDDDDDDEGMSGLSSLLSIQPVPMALSKRACQRLVHLYLQALNTILSANNSSSSEGGDDTTNTDGENRRLVLERLCEVLSQDFSTASLVDTVARALKKHYSTTSETLKILKDLASSSEGGAFGPAISIGRQLAPQDLKTEWLDLLLQRTLLSTTSSSLSSSTTLHQIHLCASNGGSSGGVHVTTTEWNDVVCPLLDKQLRSNPEKSMEVIQTFVSSCCTTKRSSTAKEETTVSIEQLLPSLHKQLKSTKVPIRSCAQQLVLDLHRLEQQRVRDNDDGATSIVVPKETATKGLLGLTLPDHREGAYGVLTDIAINIAASVTGGSSCTLVLDDVSTTLSGIVTTVSKETKTAASARESGISAMIHWMALTKKQRGGSGSDGYAQALKYLRQPLVSTKPNGPDTVQRLGAGLLQQVPVELQESMIVDLLSSSSPDGTKVEKGLQALIDGAEKKATTATCTEGLLGIYVLLVNALAIDSKQLPANVDKALSAGTTSLLAKTSFLFGSAMMDALPSNNNNRLLSQLLSRTIALYVKWIVKSTEKPTGYFKKSTTTACRTFATCVLFASSTTATATATKSFSVPMEVMLSNLSTIVTYEGADAAQILLRSLLELVNQHLVANEELQHSLNATKEAREAHGGPGDAAGGSSGGSLAAAMKVKGKCSPTDVHHGLDLSIVRRVASKLCMTVTEPNAMGLGLILMHLGTTPHKSKHQRSALNTYTIGVMERTLSWSSKDDTLKAIAQQVVRYGIASTTVEEEKEEGVSSISLALQQGVESLLTSLGGIGCLFDPTMDDPEDEELQVHQFVRKLLVESIAPHMAEQFKRALKDAESLSEDDVDLYKSPMGKPYKPNDESSNGNGGADGAIPEKKANVKKAGGKSRRAKGGGGSFGDDDDEWEREMKAEMAKKKKASGNTTATLSAEDKALAKKQDSERKRIGQILGTFKRGLGAIKSACLSDIEIGNSVLPSFGTVVVGAAISSRPAFQGLSTLKSQSLDCLVALASCVYEIEEIYSSSVARALCLCCEELKEDGTLGIVPFKSPCPPAATTVTEMDDFGDKMSGPSFGFLFPVIQACLMGPRTPSGCEGVLRVLSLHTPMLAGEEKDSVVAGLRKEIAASILALLAHDRSLAFTNPTPIETLADCYGTTDATNGGPPLTTSELSPLLDERGALGGRHSRAGSMVALETVASKHPKLVKNNPLIENRIWMNCFEKDDGISEAARKAWLAATGGSDASSLSKPSPMYSIPLLPLLSHDDDSISQAAAKANASAMGMHPGSVERNLLKLCSTYVQNYPTSFGGSKASSKGPSLDLKPLPPKKPVVAPAPKKKPISTGLPKKKTTKKKTTALDIMGKPSKASGGIGRPKATKKKSSAVAAALLKPKEERTFDQTVLENQFKSESAPIPEEKDSAEKIRIRFGMLRAIMATTDSSANMSLQVSSLQLVTGFLMAYGLADGNDGVREEARNALRDVVATNGNAQEAIAFLLPNLESVLETGRVDVSVLGSLPAEKVPKDVDASDRRKEGAVVALGAVALHLKGEENETKIDNTVDMLLSTLSTPSEGVQKSVADCLVKLMKKGRTQERLESILTRLIRECLNGATLAIRRGSAYGISAVVKGSGIGSLKKYDVVKQLEETFESGTSTNKEGSLFAIELLSSRLGLLFEPYVIVLLPSLLKSFSDGSDYVRTAASNTAGLIMSKLSAHGVKLVMPAVLKSFEDPAWRTKQASILMLGNMSHLAPKQLASALPKVVPKLTEAFADTHPKVKASAEEALQEISKVVKNPEISSISSVLLTALTDPSDGTVTALEALIETEFLHAIDAPSLALIVPILHRGLRDRVASTKRYGALIAGNICTMINNPKDFVPYLPTLIPDLKLALLDPIPDVRSTSAKALGSLTRGLGEASLPDLRQWLIEKLREVSITSAERSGAAQGLSEILIAGGADTVEDVMRAEILPLRSHPQAATREGVLWVLSFLPSALGQTFTPLIDVSLPALIGGLSDESEPVRDVAMRAGRVLIRSHGKVHFDKILPSLEAGFDDDDYRIRVASLMLLGDLLSMIGGTSVLKGDGDTQDDIRKAEKAQAQIALTLGAETRKRVLSLLYLSRSDTTVVVRQNAVQVWKTIVSVTARTLRDILPVLVEHIVDALASGHPEQTQVAGRCLGDIVNKLGDSVLPEIIPVLRNALYDGDEHTRRGVCVGLSEVISCSTRDQIMKYIEIIVKVVQDALCDEDEGVRQMAASCFQSLHSVVGNKALDEIVPSLLVALEYGDADDIRRVRALNGLTGILSIRSRELLPYIIPRLISSPITKNHAEALAGIAEVTGATIHMHFASIIPALIMSLSTFFDGEDDDEERESAIRDSVRSICHNVDETGVNWLLSEVASKCGSDKPEIRFESCWMLQTVVEERKDYGDFYDQLPIILRELVYRLIDDNTKVLKAGNAAFSALTTNVPAEELVKNIEFMRNLIASIVSDARRRKGGVGDGEFLMPGFNMPKGLDPLLPIYSEGILYGSPTIREVTATGLGELIEMTASKYLAGKLVVKMVGPLLRIVGDRNPAEVKIAILRTLGLVLVKGGPALRAFVPQFQTTFVKALADPSRQVRVEAIHALGLLMPLSTRVDPLIKELVSSSRGKDGAVMVAAVQTATLEALAIVLKKGGKKAKLPESIPSALGASKDLLFHEDEGVREGAAKVMGNACEILGAETTGEVIEDDLLDSSSESSVSAEARHGRACGLHHIFVAAGSLVDESTREDMVDRLIEYTVDDKSSVREAACVGLGSAVGTSGDPSSLLQQQTSSVLLTIMRNKQEPLEVHKAVARGLSYLCVLAAPSFAEDGHLVNLFGKTLLDGCLELALSGSQRVQYAFNDVLWLALGVEHGDEAGLEAYGEIASFDNLKSMKTLYTKVLGRIKAVTLDQ